jgi:hypothetical protein
LAIVARGEPVTRSGTFATRQPQRDANLLERGMIASTPHHRFVATRDALDLLSLRDLADLPPLI